MELEPLHQAINCEKIYIEKKMKKTISFKKRLSLWDSLGQKKMKTWPLRLDENGSYVISFTFF